MQIEEHRRATARPSWRSSCRSFERRDLYARHRPGRSRGAGLLAESRQGNVRRRAGRGHRRHLLHSAESGRRWRTRVQLRIHHSRGGCRTRRGAKHVSALVGICQRAYVCLEGDSLVGYVFADKHTGEIVVLALLPEWEGKGIGRKLLAMMVADLAKLGLQRLFLGCSSDPKVRSCGFYRHLGWKSTGTFDATRTKCSSSSCRQSRHGRSSSDFDARPASAGDRPGKWPRWP
jgi:ribosomal protein S18 acetylase RimI-like enzyme